MKKGICVVALASYFLLIAGLSQAVAAPISVYPNPVQFGTVPLQSPSYPTIVYMGNTTVNAVTITGITITGTNSADFAFDGPTCVGTISGNQTCEMYMQFTPSAMGARSASLQITISGQTTPTVLPLDGTGGNPIPAISSVSPNSIYEDSPTTTVTINGSGFLSTSVAYLNNQPALTTTYVSATQIKAQIPASYLVQPTTDYLSVTNPAPGGGTSASSIITVIGLEPTLNSLSPNFMVAGSAAGPIAVYGSNFQSGSKVTWNGTAIPTTYISSNQLQAQPTTTQLSTAGIIELAVSNPAPGSLSTPITFNVTYPATVNILDLPANDMVWDPFAQLIYASIPSSYGVNGNSIAVINPATGAVTGFHFAGSEPTKLALSADAKYLYVGLNGDGSIQRLALPGFTPDINIPLTTATSGLQVANDIEVSPGSSHTIAVVMGNNNQCCGEAGSLEFFTDTTKLASSVTSAGFSQTVFASATLLYGYASGTVSKVTVSSSGGTLGTQWSGLVYGEAINYASSLIYGGGGQVLNPATGLLEGTFDTGAANCCNSNTQLLPDPTISRALVLGTTPFFGSMGITSYNLTEFTPVGVTSLNELSGNPTPAFIQWGSNGLAFILQSNCCYPPQTSQVVLVQSPTMMLTATKASSPTPIATTLSTATAKHGSWNFTVNVSGTGFVHGSQITWNGKSRTTKYLSPTQLKLYVPWSDIAAPGTANVVVHNHTPGGGTSTALTFKVE